MKLYYKETTISKHLCFLIFFYPNHAVNFNLLHKSLTV